LYFQQAYAIVLNMSVKTIEAGPDLLARVQAEQIRKLKVAPTAGKIVGRIVKKEAVVDADGNTVSPEDAANVSMAEATIRTHVEAKRKAHVLSTGDELETIKGPGKWRAEKVHGSGDFDQPTASEVRRAIAETIRNDARDAAAIFEAMGVKPKERFNVLGKKGDKHSFGGWRIDVRPPAWGDDPRYPPKPDKIASNMYNMVIAEDGSIYEFTRGADRGGPTETDWTQVQAPVVRKGRKSDRFLQSRVGRLERQAARPAVAQVSKFQGSDQLASHIIPKSAKPGSTSPAGVVDNWRNKLASFVETTLGESAAVSALGTGPEMDATRQLGGDGWTEGEIVSPSELPQGAGPYDVIDAWGEDVPPQGLPPAPRGLPSGPQNLLPRPPIPLPPAPPTSK